MKICYLKQLQQSRNFVFMKRIFSASKFMYNNFMKITYLIETARSPECVWHLVFKLAVYTDTRCHRSYSVRNSSRSCATVHIRAIEFQRWPVAINKVTRRASYFTWLSLSLSRNCEILWKFSISPSSAIDIFNTRNTRHWYSSMARIEFF